MLAQPNNRIDLYIAAPNRRRNSVHRQLLRPSFEHLLPKCRFVDFERIEDLAVTIETFPVARGARVTGLIEGETFPNVNLSAYDYDR